MVRIRSSHSPLSPFTLGALMLGFLLCLIFSAGVLAQESTSPPSVVDPALLQALEVEDRVGARIFFSVPAGPDLSLRESKVDPEIDPVVFELAEALLPGDLSLVQYEWVRALRGVVDAQVVERLRQHPQVLGIELDESVPITDPDELALDHLGSCVPSATKACVQGGRFGIRVGTLFVPGNFAPIAVSGSQSAVFHFGNSANWEVLAKVLNGCAINGRYWVFGAGATTQNFVLNIEDTVRGIIVGYGSSSCPIVDTSFWTC